MKKTATMDLKGKPYAKVPERVKEFRTDCPNGKTEQDHILLEDGQTEFRAWIWKDKTQLLELIKAGVTDKEALRESADANGTAKNVVKGEKDFEKLETIALGRALANLGYLASGEIASSEEMELYYAEKEARIAEAVFECSESIGNCETVDALKAYWTSLSAELINVPALVEAKNARYKQLIAK